MPDRISVIEQYNNRDLIAQIYRIISLTESSTIVRVSTVQEGSHVTVTLEMYDGTSKTFTFDCVGDVTTDTDQSINALKHFMMGIGITGPTHIDGDVRIVNGHYLQLAGDLDVGGDTELAGDLVVHGQSEISGMSFEESSGKTVISNDLGISTPSPFEVPTTDTGVRDTNAVNGKRLQNDLDNYAQMFRLTGNQKVQGAKEFSHIIVPYELDRGKQILYSNDKKWKIVYKYTSNVGVIIRMNIIWGFNTFERYGMADVIASDAGFCKGVYYGTNTFGMSNVIVAKDTEGMTNIIVCNGGGYNGVTVELTNCTRYGQQTSIPGFIVTNEILDQQPTVGERFTNVIVGSGF